MESELLALSIWRRGSRLSRDAVKRSHWLYIHYALSHEIIARSGLRHQWDPEISQDNAREQGDARWQPFGEDCHGGDKKPVHTIQSFQCMYGLK